MLTKEKIQHHISHLQEQHDLLDKQIIQEEAQHTSCAVVGILKKKKLKLKDEIESFKVKLNGIS